MLLIPSPSNRRNVTVSRRKSTSGANNTSSVSMVTYSNLIRGLNLGIGSAMSVLIFITTGIIAFIFIKAFGAAAPGADTGGRK